MLNNLFPPIQEVREALQYAGLRTVGIRRGFTQFWEPMLIANVHIMDLIYLDDIDGAFASLRRQFKADVSYLASGNRILMRLTGVRPVPPHAMEELKKLDDNLEMP